MPSTPMILLILQVGLFVAWAAMMFRMLWAIARRKKGQLDGGGIGDQMGAFTGFFRDPKNRRFLVILGILSALLMAVNVATAMLMDPT